MREPCAYPTRARQGGRRIVNETNIIIETQTPSKPRLSADFMCAERRNNPVSFYFPKPRKFIVSTAPTFCCLTRFRDGTAANNYVPYGAASKPEITCMDDDPFVCTRNPSGEPPSAQKTTSASHVNREKT